MAASLIIVTPGAHPLQTPVLHPQPRATSTVSVTGRAFDPHNRSPRCGDPSLAQDNIQPTME